jgi:hypothetical protein
MKSSAGTNGFIVGGRRGNTSCKSICTRFKFRRFAESAFSASASSALCSMLTAVAGPGFAAFAGSRPRSGRFSTTM